MRLSAGGKVAEGRFASLPTGWPYKTTTHTKKEGGSILHGIKRAEISVSQLIKIFVVRVSDYPGNFA